MKTTRRYLFAAVAGLFSAAFLPAKQAPRPPKKLKVWAWRRGALDGCPFWDEEGFIVLGFFGEDRNIVWAANFPVRRDWRPRKLLISDWDEKRFRRYRERCGTYLEFAYPHEIVMDACGVFGFFGLFESAVQPRA